MSASAQPAGPGEQVGLRDAELTVRSLARDPAVIALALRGIQTRLSSRANRSRGRSSARTDASCRFRRVPFVSETTTLK
jgi:hypothetical protein